jgi:hypothetical protein
MTEGNGGELRPAGRFERIERLLERIEDKLDKKADQADLDSLTKRIEIQERQRAESMAMATPLLEQFKVMGRDLEDIKLERAKESGMKAGLDVMSAEFKANREEMKTNRRWVIGTTLSVVVALVGTISYVIVHH